MDKKILILQQYIDTHPILLEEKSTRIEYMSLINYLTNEGMKHMNLIGNVEKPEEEYDEDEDEEYDEEDDDDEELEYDEDVIKDIKNKIEYIKDKIEDIEDEEDIEDIKYKLDDIKYKLLEDIKDKIEDIEDEEDIEDIEDIEELKGIIEEIIEYIEVNIEDIEEKLGDIEVNIEDIDEEDIEEEIEEDIEDIKEKLGDTEEKVEELEEKLEEIEEKLGDIKEKLGDTEEKLEELEEKLEDIKEKLENVEVLGERLENLKGMIEDIEIEINIEELEEVEELGEKLRDTEEKVEELEEELEEIKYKLEDIEYMVDIEELEENIEELKDGLEDLEEELEDLEEEYIENIEVLGEILEKLEERLKDIIGDIKEKPEDIVWREYVFALMQEKIVKKEEFVPIKIDNIISVGRKNKITNLSSNLREYIYNILIDCLLINAFDDIKEGKKILEMICEFFPSYENNFRILFEKFYGISKEEIVSNFSKVEKIYKIINSNRSFLKKFEKLIVITGNMSAGKSTLINALIGNKLAKTQNDACTSWVHYFYNKSELNYNEEKIILITNKITTKGNSLETYVETGFESIKEINNRVCLIDTPGVNSSRNKEHREVTEKIIEEIDCNLLIFVLNGENIGTDDDIRYLNYIKEVYSGDILFLINKLDNFKRGVDSITETLQKVKDNLVEIGFKSPKIYPISAYAAYLAKMSMFGRELSEDEQYEREFRKGKLTNPEFRYDKYFENKPFEIDEDDENQELLRNSGILALEKIIYK